MFYYIRKTLKCSSRLIYLYDNRFVNKQIELALSIKDFEMKWDRHLLIR